MSGRGDAWPGPKEIGSQLPPVPVFNPTHLPESLRPLVEDVSERMQTPCDFAAIASIISLAGCVGRGAAIRPKLEDTGWSVIPNLWGAIIAPPGVMKSPLLNAVTRPLFWLHEKWRAEYEIQIESFESEKQESELRLQAWKETYKAAVKKGIPVPIQPDATLAPPLQKRLIITDATSEKLHSILAENPAGITVVRDELIGLLGDLDKPGRESDRAFFLACWAGDTPHAAERIGRGSIYVPACCISLIGNIQPTRLRTFLSDVAEGGPNDDGLFQRLQLLVWPELVKWNLVDRAPNTKAIVLAENVFHNLATSLSAEFPLQLRFASDAQHLFFGWWSQLERKVRGEEVGALHPALIAHLSKYRSLMPTLAGLFELADRAASSASLDELSSISLTHTEQAVCWCDYLELHARRVYACILSPAQLAAAELARHITNGDVPEIFTARSIYRHHWSLLDSAEKVEPALDILEDAHWIRSIALSTPEVGGRPSDVWTLNPKLVRK
jgi:hypothetical protein